MSPNPPKSFHTGMPYNEYRAHEAIAKSDLDLVNESPAQLIWKKNAPVDPRESNAGIFGSAFHALTLEPEKFDSEYIVEPQFDKRTKAGKDAAAEFAKNSTGKTILSDDDFQTLYLMRESVMAHPTARQIIESADFFEASTFYNDPVTGLQCKSRTDITATKFNVIADLKSTKAITKWLYRDILDYRYHVQEVHYSKAYESHFGEKPTFLFIFCSKEKTFGQHRVKVVRLDDAFLTTAEDDRNRNLRTIAECRETGVYNGIERLFIGG